MSSERHDRGPHGDELAGFEIGLSLLGPVALVAVAGGLGVIAALALFGGALVALGVAAKTSGTGPRDGRDL